MFASGMLKVGVFVLLFSTTLLADTIPFDYWYGRIVGGQQSTIEYKDSRPYYALMQLSHQFGDRNDFGIAANRFLNLWPGWSAWPTAYEPILSGKIQLSKSLRLELPLVDYHWTHAARNDPESWSGLDSTVADIQLGLSYLSNAGTLFTDDRSLSIFIDGLVPAQGETEAQANVRLLGLNSTYRRGEQLEWPLLDQMTQDTRDRSLEVEVAARRGYSNALMLGIAGSFKRRSYGNNLAYLRIGSPSSPLFDTVATEFVNEQTEDRGRFGLTARYMFSPTTWIDGSIHYRHRIVRTKEIDDYWQWSIDYVRGENQEFFTGDFELRFKRFSRNISIQRQKILDNFSNYYADQIDRGTWSVEASMKWSTTEMKTERFGLGGLNLRPGDDLYSLDADLILRYYALANLYFDCGVSFTSLTDTLLFLGEALQFQKLRPRFAANFQSYVWDSNLRREISWDKVSDIDYSLGPLMRAGDWRVSAFVEPPYKKSFEPKDWGLLPGNSHLKWKNDWRTGVDAAIGVMSDVEGELQFRWNRIEQELRSPSNYVEEWFVAPGGSVQIRQFMRFAGSFENHYVRDTYVGNRFGDYRRTWALKARVDVRF
jgi:hypothetical protein